MDRKGDKAKQPEGCEGTEHTCPNMKEVGGGMSGERYACEVCGAGYYLDYDDMR